MQFTTQSIRKTTLRGQMTLMVLSATVLVALTVIASLSVYEFLLAKRESHDHLLGHAEIINRNIAPALVFNDSAEVSRNLEVFAADPSLVWLIVQNKQGKVMGYYHRGPKAVSYAELETTAHRLKQETGGKVSSFFDLSNDLAWPIRYDGEVLGTLYIEQDYSPLLKRLQQLVWITLGVVLVSATVCRLFTRRLGAMVGTPVEQMADLMHRISETRDYGLRSELKDDNEFGRLSDGLNEMLEEIERRDHNLEERQKHLDHLANYDGLTGLPNRILFEERLQQSFEHARRREEFFALLFIDLDDFKLVNDTYGHKAGDLLLCETARRLSEAVRAEDTVARMGGDEFTGILSNVHSAENAVSIARKLLHGLVATYRIDQKDMFVGASIGVAVYPLHGTSIQELMRRADLAMYHAKELGKNNVVVFNSNLQHKAEDRAALLNDLQLALEQNQFELYYQPKICLETGNYVGAEAFLRWNHPERGLVGPNSFLPLAEESGLIIPIGNWVIRQCCREMKIMHSCNLFLPSVSINLSPLQLLRENLVDQVRDAIFETNICCNTLEVEIPESVLLDDRPQVRQNIAGLQDLGIKISIDDFASGASSLAKLSELHIHSLKLSADLLKQTKDSKMVRALLAVTESIELDLLYKGVETFEQEQFVRSLGGNYAQGYHYSRPIPLTSFSAFMMSLNRLSDSYSHCPNHAENSHCCRLPEIGLSTDTERC